MQLDAAAVQTKAHELEIEKHNLTKKVMEFEKWAETETQYELKEIARGMFVYAYKKTDQSPKPMHWLCTNCWKDKIKSIIQKPLGDAYICPKCKSAIYPDLAQRRGPDSGEEYDPFGY